MISAEKKDATFVQDVTRVGTHSTSASGDVAVEEKAYSDVSSEQDTRVSVLRPTQVKHLAQKNFR